MTPPKKSRSFRMKQINIAQPFEFSANVSTKSAFAVVDTNPYNESERDATECHGYRCSFENQKCLAGTDGSLGLNWVCKSNEWIEWIKG